MIPLFPVSHEDLSEIWQISDVSVAELKPLILEKHQQENKNNACVFDLDGTLFDVGGRTLGIMAEWLENCVQQKNENIFNAHLLEKLKQINRQHLGYSLGNILENAGFDLRNEDVAEIFTDMEKLWKARFFDGEALVQYDDAIPGCVNFVKELYDLGIHIVYLTGRYENGMKAGTLAQLKKFGLPMDDVTVILKKNKLLEDQVFKSQEIKKISERYNVIANFENEYLNIAHMSFEVPTAHHVIVDSHHSGRPVPRATTPFYRIAHFL
jgi:beta-phosphoglucomutase-like phosphatase (HAD superfamily)